MSSQLVGQGLGSNWQSLGTGDPSAGEPRPPSGTWRGGRGLEMARDRAQKWQILLQDIGPGEHHISCSIGIYPGFPV